MELDGQWGMIEFNWPDSAGRDPSMWPAGIRLPPAGICASVAAAERRWWLGADPHLGGRRYSWAMRSGQSASRSIRNDLHLHLHPPLSPPPGLRSMMHSHIAVDLSLRFIGTNYSTYLTQGPRVQSHYCWPWRGNSKQCANRPTPTPTPAPAPASFSLGPKQSKEQNPFPPAFPSFHLSLSCSAYNWTADRSTYCTCLSVRSPVSRPPLPLLEGGSNTKYTHCSPLFAPA